MNPAFDSTDQLTMVTINLLLFQNVPLLHRQRDCVEILPNQFRFCSEVNFKGVGRGREICLLHHARTRIRNLVILPV